MSARYTGLPSLPLPMDLCAGRRQCVRRERTPRPARRHQVVGADFGVDSSLKVAIARKHRSHDQILLFDSFETSTGSGLSFRCKSCSRTRQCETSASRDTASARLVADNRAQPSTREPATFSPIRYFESVLNRFLRQQPRRDQHRRIRRVRATGNRRDHHAAMP